MPTIKVSTVKPAGGGEYTNLQTWESTEQRNLVSANEIEIADVYGGGNAGNNTALTIAGWTTDRTRYIEVRAAFKHEHLGKGRPFTRSKAYIETDGAANTTTVDVRARDVRWTGMQCLKTGGATNVPNFHVNNVDAGGSQQMICNRSIFYLDSTGSTGTLRISGGGEGTTLGQTENHVFNNCLILSRHTGSSTGAVECANGSGGSNGVTRLHNCTILALNGNRAINVPSVTGHICITRNCYLRATTTCYAGLAANYRKGGGDATSTTEALFSTHRSIAFNSTRFTDATTNQEDIHLVDDGSNILLKDGDNIGGRSFLPPIAEFSYIEDWEGDVRVRVSGILNQPGSGFYSIGADQSPKMAGPAYLGGYMLGTFDGEISGFLGGYIPCEGHPGPTGFLGGYCLSKVLAGRELAGLLGGFLFGPDFKEAGPAFLGGYCLSVPLIDVGPNFLGAWVQSLRQAEATLGGYVFGIPDRREFVATRARTLVAATSDLVAGQKLHMDAKIIFKQIFQREFRARLKSEKIFQNDVHGKVEVEKFQIPPTVFIQSVTFMPGSGESLPSGQPVPNFDPNGVRRVCVVASGYLGDGEQFVSAHIDFGDPFDPLGGFKPFLSISGFSGPPPWSGCHDYNISGLYVITARAQDNRGMVGMDCSGLNLASGAVPGFHFPVISISGTPRFGEVPPSMQVQFTTISSGISLPPYLPMEILASQVKSPTDERILWNFGNRERSVRKNPVTYYQSPGLYAPALRFLFTNPSGAAGVPGYGVKGKFMVSDTLLIGFNR